MGRYVYDCIYECVGGCVSVCMCKYYIYTYIYIHILNYLAGCRVGWSNIVAVDGWRGGMGISILFMSI